MRNIPRAGYGGDFRLVGRIPTAIGDTQMTIAITGVTGNMGQAVLAALRNANCITKIKLLARNKKRIEKLLNRHKDMRNRIDVVFGTLDDKKAIESLI